MVLSHPMAEEVRLPFAGIVVSVDWPVCWVAVRVVDPVFVDAGGEGRMFDVEEEASTVGQRAMHLAVDAVQILDIVQDQIGDDYIICRSGYAYSSISQTSYVMRSPALMALAFTIMRSLPSMPENRGGSHARGVRAVPPIAAAQIQYLPAAQVGEQGLQLMSFPGSLQAAFASCHVRVFCEEFAVVVDAAYVVCLHSCRFVHLIGRRPVCRVP